LGRSTEPLKQGVCSTGLFEPEQATLNAEPPPREPGSKRTPNQGYRADKEKAAGQVAGQIHVRMARPPEAAGSHLFTRCFRRAQRSSPPTFKKRG